MPSSFRYLLALLLVSCGGEVSDIAMISPGGAGGGGGAGGAGAGGGAGAAATGSCATFAAAICARRWECIPEAFRVGHGYGDAFGTEERCRDRMTLACEWWQTLPGTTATDEALDACSTSLGALDCHGATFSLTRETGGCAFSLGSLPAKSPCGSRLQCASGRCDYKLAQSCGECAANGLPEGGGLGAPCSGKETCSEDLACVNGVCSLQALLGEACGPTQECSRYAEVTCNESTQRCEPLAEGCGQPGASPCVDGDCVGFNDMGKGKCVKQAAEGEACDYSGPGCLYPSRCVAGKCAPPPPNACP